MEEKVRVNLDGLHSLDIRVCKTKRTIVTELVIPDEPPELIYAEKFDEPCNYLKTAIKRGILYLDGRIEPHEKPKPDKRKSPWLS